MYNIYSNINFPIVNFSFICSNIPAAPAYGVCISQLIRYSRACVSYQDFLDKGLLLTKKLLNQGFLLVKLKSSLRKFYGCHQRLGWPLWNICVTNDHGYVPLVVNTYRSFPRSWLITVCVTRLTRRVSLVEQELLTLPEHLSSPPVFSGVRVTRSLWGSCYSIFSFIGMLCWSLFVLLYFFFWPLCCLFFFDIRILIAPFSPLVSSNSSTTVRGLELTTFTAYHH
jgi:hypothetical protein